MAWMAFWRQIDEDPNNYYAILIATNLEVQMDNKPMDQTKEPPNSGLVHGGLVGIYGQQVEENMEKVS